MQLLVDLSADFDAPSARKKVDPFAFGSLRKDKTAIPRAMHSAAKLIDAEIVRQSARETIEQVDAILARLDEERANQGFFKKLTSREMYRQDKRHLDRQKDIASTRTHRADKIIEGILNSSYEGATPSRPGRADEASQRNESLNARFFSEDRAGKINRAIELRIKYLDHGALLLNVPEPGPSIGRFR